LRGVRPEDAFGAGSMFVAGYKHLILDCLACGETERRLVFRHVSEPWRGEPTTLPNDGRDEVCADALNMTIVEPQVSSRTYQAELSAEPERPSGSWQHRIENVRVRLDDLRKRAELANQEARAAQQDQEERKRFTVFWEELAARKPASQPKQPIAPRLAPLPRSLSLVVGASADIGADRATKVGAAWGSAKSHAPLELSTSPSPYFSSSAFASSVLSSASSGSVVTRALALVRQVLS
jgi:hypothetical protein